MNKYDSKIKKVDLYEIGQDLTMMNIRTFNSEGLPERVDTYIGIEGNGFVQVGMTEDLSAPGVVFRYADYVKAQQENIKVLIDIFYTNAGIG